MDTPVKTKEPMHWDRMKDNRCPKDKCYAILKEKGAGYECDRDSCTFFIRKERFNEVIKSLYEAENNIKTGFGKRKTV